MLKERDSRKSYIALLFISSFPRLDSIWFRQRGLLGERIVRRQKSSLAGSHIPDFLWGGRQSASKCISAVEKKGTDCVDLLRLLCHRLSASSREGKCGAIKYFHCGPANVLAKIENRLRGNIILFPWMIFMSVD